MTLLASILPGFRDIRSHFLAGAMWAVAITMVVTKHQDGLQRTLDYSDLEVTWNQLPQSFRLGIIATSTYLVGMVLPAWVAAIIRRILRVLSAIIEPERPDARWRTIRRWFGVRLIKLLEPIFPQSSGAEGLIRSAAQAGIPAETSDYVRVLVGVNIVMPEIDLAAQRLSKELPEQYQLYDRIKSEGDFRRAIAPALAVTGATLATHAFQFSYGLVVAILSFGIAVTIASQGHKLRLQAESLIASAMYLGWTSTPTVDAIGADLRTLHAEVDQVQLHQELSCVLGHISELHDTRVNYWVASVLRHPSRLIVLSRDESVRKVYNRFARFKIGIGEFQVEPDESEQTELPTWWNDDSSHLPTK